MKSVIRLSDYARSDVKEIFKIADNIQQLELAYAALTHLQLSIIRVGDLPIIFMMVMRMKTAFNILTSVNIILEK